MTVRRWCFGYDFFHCHSGNDHSNAVFMLCFDHHCHSENDRSMVVLMLCFIIATMRATMAMTFQGDVSVMFYYCYCDIFLFIYIHYFMRVKYI